MYKKIKEPLDYGFSTPEDGVYAIYIEASCASGKILGFFGGEDLRVEIDDIKFREIPAEKRSQYFNIPPAWNGAELEGKIKTVVFVLKLNKGKHNIKFIPKKGAVIHKEPEIKKFDSGEIIKNIQSEEKNRQPWITGVRWLYHKAQGITRDNKRYWRSWKEAVKGYGPGTDEYVEKVWSVYTKGIDKKSNIKLWSLVLTLLLAPGLFWFVNYCQGWVFMKYKDLGEEHTCVGRGWLEIGIVDGLRIKKAMVGPVDGLPWSTATGIIKGRIVWIIMILIMTAAMILWYPPIIQPETRLNIYLG
jgi:hypothetical protein